MARFYGAMHGNRGEATRMGTPASGFFAHIRGWTVGAEVEMMAQGDDDACTVSATGGSGGGRGRQIAVLRNVNGSVEVVLYGKDGKPMRPFTIGL